VLLHAFPLGARMWEPQHALADAGWHVVMPQFRGFDCREPDEVPAASLDDYAGDVADLLETINIERAVIGGLSMGGYVTLTLYRHAPELFAAMVLADTRADADTADVRRNRDRLIAVAESGGSAAVADDMIPKLLGASTRATRPGTEMQVRALVAANIPRALIAAQRAMSNRPDSTSVLDSIEVPALVVVGEEDVLTPPPLASAMAARIARAQASVIPAAGHLSSLEQPAAFNAALTAFLDRL